ncbi:MAG: hypothetical protein ABIR31_09300, partial [Ginsengibacter sp.]
AEKDRISQPSQGSEKLGTETTETHSRGISAGTDTQTKIAAVGAQEKEKDQHGKKTGINDDEKVVRNTNGTNTFPDRTQTDE